MKLEALQFFNSEEGKKILSEYKDVVVKDLPALTISLSKKNLPFLSEITTLLKLRKNSSDKFSQAEEMFFTSDGLEQSTGEIISKYVAQRFKEVINHGLAVDLTCGIGGNTIFLAKYFQVRAVDIDEVHLYCAQHNSLLYGTDQNIEFIHGRAEDNIKDARAFIIDPQRIRSGKTKTRSLYNSQPNITSLLPKMLEITEDICVKISPAFDYEEIGQLPGSPEVEIVSEDDNNKAAFLWFGKFKDASRKATILDGDQPVSFNDKINLKSLKYSEKFRKYLFLPNKAIIKARLVDEVSCQYDLFKLSDNDELLTFDKFINYPKRVFRSFEVVDYDLFSVKNVKNILKKNNLDRAHIVARHYLINIDELRKKLKLKESGDYTVILTYISNQKYVVLARNL